VKVLPHPAQSGLEKGGLNPMRKTENGDLRMLPVLFSQRPADGTSRRGLVTVRLQPQMKKYRCLWYKSSANHNILYFVPIPGIPFLNTGICLWKVKNGLAPRGFAVPGLPQTQCSPGLRRLHPHFQA
jgi:hypothetical protein